MLELGTLLFADDDVVVSATGDAHDEFGTEEKADLADAVDVCDVLTVETEEFGIEMLKKTLIRFCFNF